MLLRDVVTVHMPYIEDPAQKAEAIERFEQMLNQSNHSSLEQLSQADLTLMAHFIAKCVVDKATITSAVPMREVASSLASGSVLALQLDVSVTFDATFEKLEKLMKPIWVSMTMKGN